MWEQFNLIIIQAIAKSRELSLDLRTKLVKAHKSGEGQKAISKWFNVLRSTVQSIISKGKVDNYRVNWKYCSPKAKIAPKLECKVARDISHSPINTSKAILQHLEDSGVKARWTTFEGVVHKKWLFLCWPLKLLFSLIWAQDRFPEGLLTSGIL